MKCSFEKQLIAQFLSIILLLQGCVSNSISSNPKVKLKFPRNISTIQEPPNLVSDELLLDLDLVAEGGHVVTLHEEDGKLRADVKMNVPTGFDHGYRDLPVYIGEGMDQYRVMQLNKKLQQRLVEVVIPTTNRPGHVYIGKRGLLGGMKRASSKKGDEEESDLQLLFKRAREGDEGSQFQLGARAYEIWQKDPSNEAEYDDAMSWLSKAAEQGHKVAASLLEEMHCPFRLLEKQDKEKFKEEGRSKEKEKENTHV